MSPIPLPTVSEPDRTMTSGRNVLWSNEEKSLIAQYYGRVPVQHLVDVLPWRTYGSIRKMALKMGTIPPHTRRYGRAQRKWTQQEDSIINETFTTSTTATLLSLLPERSWCAIKSRASMLGISGRPAYLRNRYAVNRAFFDDWSDIMSYVFGYWMADGHMGQHHNAHNVCFTCTDKGHLEMVRDLMESTHRIRHDDRRHYGRRVCYTLRINSDDLWRALYSIGGRPNKSHTATMPDIPGQYVRSFVRGLIDGDGTVRWALGAGQPKPDLRLCGTRSLLDGVARVLDNHVGVGYFQPTIAHATTYHIPYTGLRAKALAIWLYRDEDPALTRKAAIAREFRSWEPSPRSRHTQKALTPKLQAVLLGR